MCELGVMPSFACLHKAAAVLIAYSEKCVALNQVILKANRDLTAKQRFDGDATDVCQGLGWWMHGARSTGCLHLSEAKCRLHAGWCFG